MKYLIILSLLITGCTSIEKMFSKVVAEEPERVADYCARTYVGKVDTVIKGVQTVTFDTIYTGGETVFDTVAVKDTVRIVKTVQLPARVVTKLLVRVDTVKKESPKLLAELDACKVSKDNAISNEREERKEKEKQIGYKKKWRAAAIVSGALIFLWLGLLIRRKVKK